MARPHACYSILLVSAVRLKHKAPAFRHLEGRLKKCGYFSATSHEQGRLVLDRSGKTALTSCTVFSLRWRAFSSQGYTCSTSMITSDWSASQQLRGETCPYDVRLEDRQIS